MTWFRKFRPKSPPFPPYKNPYPVPLKENKEPTKPES